jgi:Mrp family chromosome partitioning ATPase
LFNILILFCENDLLVLSEVEWVALDYVVIDTPPGTSAEHLPVAQYLLNAGLTGAIMLTTLHEVALLDV